MAYTTDDTCKYAKSHEWIRVSDNIATVGISDYAQQELGDIVYVEFPEVGDVVTQGEPCGIVESVKAASDFYAPVSGEVIAVNTTLEDAPETVNEDPYGDAWLIQVRLSSPEQLDSLLTPEQYRAWVEEEAEGGH